MPIATPKFVSDYDEKYHRHLKEVVSYLESQILGHRERARLTSELHKRVNCQYDLSRTMPSPVAHYNREWSRYMSFLFRIRDDMVRRHEAQNLLCHRLNNAAWYYDQSRRQYLMSKVENNSWHSCEHQIAQTALYGEFAPQSPVPAFRTIEKWFENFNLPDIEDIDQTREWYTLQEWVTISRYNPQLDLPKTIKEMRKFASQFVTPRKRTFCRKMQGKLHYKFI